MILAQQLFHSNVHTHKKPSVQLRLLCTAGEGEVNYLLCHTNLSIAFLSLQTRQKLCINVYMYLGTPIPKGLVCTFLEYFMLSQQLSCNFVAGHQKDMGGFI